MQKIIVVSSSSTPRIKKRLIQLSKKYEVTFYYFKRTNDNEKLRASILELTREHYQVGIIENGKYLDRLFKYLKLLLKLLFKKNKNFYFFGTDFQIFIPFLAGKKYLEIGDLRIGDSKGLKKNIFNLFEKITLKPLTRLIVTSEHHYNDYYKSFLKSDQILVIRNKLELNSILTNLTRHIAKPNEVINIGLFGLIRYEKSTDKLLKFVKKYPNKFNLHLSGIPYGSYTLDFINDLVTTNINVFWHGSYLYPNDLQKIYSKVDLTFVVYDNTFENVRKAIPNKLYESTLFNRPILAATNTKFGEEIIKMKIGKEIPIDNFENFEKSLLEITKDEISNWSSNMNNIGFDDIFENDQYLKNI